MTGCKIDIEIPRRLSFRLRHEAGPHFVLLVGPGANPEASDEFVRLEGAKANGPLAVTIA